MNASRFKLALEKLPPEEWAAFEILASAFLNEEFGELTRTTAGASGDKGRDSELFSEKGDSTVHIQYSVSGDWDRKIQGTASRIRENFPDTTVLIYLTSHKIGSKADALKRKLRENFGFSLDIRDQSWFLDRLNSSSAREIAAEELARKIVDPFLAQTGITSHPPSHLSRPEALAALTFLGLQWRDDEREKGLTKIAYEALVRAVLVDTDSNHRLSRSSVHQRITDLVPDHPRPRVRQYVDSALQRLEKKSVRHWTKEDEYCLTYEEVRKVEEYKTEAALADEDLMQSIEEVSASLISGGICDDNVRERFVELVRRVVETLIFNRSETFAVAVSQGTVEGLSSLDHRSLIELQLSEYPLPPIEGVDWVALLEEALWEMLRSDNEVVQEYFRSLLDSYTLMAFLRQTPDLQRAVRKLFAYGDIWLDTSVVLPLLAEFLDDEGGGRFTRMIKAARDAGLKLHVTPGVIEEVDSHMKRCVTCVRLEGEWVGLVPFLLKRYVITGRSRASFNGWLENFKGGHRPLEDIAEFLNDEFDISEDSLAAEMRMVPDELRNALQNIWHEAKRRRRESNVDDSAIDRLVEHDVENYCGVIGFRNHRGSSPYGYSAWWLTLDRGAFDLTGKLRGQMVSDPPSSPILSADFLVNYLAFGPARKNVAKSSERLLPVVMSGLRADWLTPDLLEEAESLREEVGHLPDRIIRRRVRDHLDAARRRIGPVALTGLDGGDDW